jgi:hypothetical protein
MMRPGAIKACRRRADWRPFRGDSADESRSSMSEGCPLAIQRFITSLPVADTAGSSDRRPSRRMVFAWSSQ